MCASSMGPQLTRRAPVQYELIQSNLLTQSLDIVKAEVPMYLELTTVEGVSEDARDSTVKDVIDRNTNNKQVFSFAGEYVKIYSSETLHCIEPISCKVCELNYSHCSTESKAPSTKD